MHAFRLALLCLMTALLPLDGIARLSQPSCAAHREFPAMQAASAMDTPMHPASPMTVHGAQAAAHLHHAAHRAMAASAAAMPSMTAAGTLAAADPVAAGHHAGHDRAHDDCRCAGVCAAHCAVSAAMPGGPALAGAAISRSEPPAAGDSRAPQPARRLDLLRPPTRALA